MININKTYLAIAGAAVGGAAVSGVATFLITKKVYKKKYEESMNNTITAIKASYEKKLALESGEVEDEEVESEVEEETSEEEEESSDDEEESDGRSPKAQVINYTKYSKSNKESTKEMPKALKDGILNLLGEDDEEDTEVEDPNAIIKKPYPYKINVDQFNDDLCEDARPWYDKKEFILFMKDFVYIGGEKVNVPILYSCDEDCIYDVIVDEELTKKLQSIGVLRDGSWARKSIALDWDDFGHPDYDYKAHEQVKRYDPDEAEFYIDKRDESYSEEMLDIEDVTEENFKNVYRELWVKRK